jgi:hypothetical protein
MKTLLLSALFFSLNLFNLNLFNPNLGMAQQKLDRTFEGKNYKEIGKAMLEYSIFKIDVYELTYYQSDDGAQMLSLVYQRDVKREHSLKGWDVGFAQNLSKELLNTLDQDIQWLKGITQDMSKGDEFLIAVNKDKDAIKLFKNQAVLGEKNKSALAGHVLSPWLGSNPVDSKVKNKLLGEK